MHRSLLILLAAVAASAIGHTGTLDDPKAGLWQQSTQLSPDGRQWRPGVKTQGCLTEAQASQWEENVRQQIAAASCTVQSLTVIGGKIDGVIACTSINQPVVQVSGLYSDSAYSVNLASSGVVGTAPVTVFAKWVGRRLGSC
jgi:Protein of unknown function (DUF3617)